MGVEFRAVRKVFPDGTVALEGLDLAFETGEFIVLLGPSGSGKTTACRLLAGLEEPTSGTLWVDGRDITALPPRAARHEHGVPELRALRPQDGLREHRLSVAHPEAAARRDRPHGARDRGDAADRDPARPPPAPALGRPGAAGRGRTRAGLAARDLPDGRAALQSRRAAPPADPDRAQAPARRACAGPSSSSPTTRRRR